MARIAVIGAGMGGLAFATAMRNSAHEVTVYEQAQELVELGAGISLWANGVRLFEEMGIAELMNRQSCETDAAYFRNEDGSVAALQPLARDNWYRKAYGHPYYGALRTDLQASMLKVLGQGSIRLGKQLVHIDDSGDEAKLHWADGTTDTADVVVGADGIKSAVRRFVDASAVPVYTGATAYRGLAKTAELDLLPEPQSFTDWMGHGQHVLNFPVGHGFEHTTIVVFVDQPGTWDAEAWRVSCDPAEVRAKFDGWHPAVAQLLEHVELGERWGLHQVTHMESWHRHRLVLIGDAAHGMLPHHGQGAISSFEDAIALAHVMNDASLPSVAEKLCAYEEERKDRGERIQKSSRELNACLHLPQGPLRQKRDARLNALSDRFSWLHDYVCGV